MCSPPARQLLIVIIPAFNEEGSIATTLQSLRELEQTLLERGVTLKLYVVDDGSRDRTRSRAAEGADRILRHQVNLGLGAAVRTGLIGAREDGADLIVKFDADLQHDPLDLLAIIEPILRDEADLVFGNRFERISYRMPLPRRIGNIAFTELMRWLTKWPLQDSQPGIFAAAKCYLSVFALPGDYNYTQQILLDAYHKGMRFAHVPVAFRPRQTGSSFVSLRYPFKVLPQILMVLVSVKPMRVFGLIGGIALMTVTLISAFQFLNWLLGYSTKPIVNVNLVLGLGLFGLQTLFFGLLAQLIVSNKK